MSEIRTFAPFTVGDDDDFKFVRRCRLAADESELELMIFLDQAGRSDDVRVLYRVGYLLDRHVSRREFFRIDLDMKFAHFAALDLDVCDARQAAQAAAESCKSRSRAALVVIAFV